MSLLLSYIRNVLILCYHFRSLVFTGICPEIPYEPPEMRFCCGVCQGPSFSFVGRPWPCVCMAGEGRCLVMLVRCLGGLARWVDDHTTFPLMISRSGDSGLPQSSLPIRTQPSPLLQEPSTAMGQVLCESVIRLIGHVLVYRSNSPQLRSRAFTSASSIIHPRPYSNHTAIISVCVHSFIQVVAS